MHIWSNILILVAGIFGLTSLLAPELRVSIACRAPPEFGELVGR